MRRWLAPFLFMLLAAAALTAPASVPAVGQQTNPTASRPYGLQVPEGYHGQHPIALVVLLHGYSSNGSAQSAYFRLGPEAERSGFLLAYPNGTRDVTGNRFWNATDACCDFYGRGVDDVAYLDGVLDEISAKYPVDPARIFLVGHSNGAFMAHRYACDRPGRVAAIVTLAGMQWKDARRCGASSPVSVLHVHGRDDGTIRYEGGSTPKGPYPGALETVGTWAGKNGCPGALVSAGRRIDLDSMVPGDETAIERYENCTGAAVELWTIEDGGHIPAFNANWAPSIWAFMAAHPKAG